MIKLSNGHEFRYMAASGSLAYKGQGWWHEVPLVKLGLIKPELFTVAIKTLTLNPRKGNLRWYKPWECIRLIPGGVVNKVGLTNPGFYWWLYQVAPKINFEKYPIMASLYGTKTELAEMTVALESINIVGIKYNVSCPNSGDKMEEAKEVIDTTKWLKPLSRHPFIIKVSVAQNYTEIAKGLAGTVEAVALNSVPWEIAFPGQRSPLWKLERRVGGGGGGVSGKPAQKHNWKAVDELVKQGALPVIGPSIIRFSDMRNLRERGVRAFSFGAKFLRNPLAPTQFVKRDMRWGG